MEFVIIAAILIVFVIFITSTLKIVRQSEAWVIETFGAYKHTWGVGLHIKLPFIHHIAKKVSLKEHLMDFEPKPVITKDNVTMNIDSVVYYHVTDPKLYTYGVGNPLLAIENLTSTTLRNIIGLLELDETLASRDHINTQMRTILDEATDPWGIRITRVEVKNIIPPRDIQDAMEKQMRAERERRESILRAEGEKKSAILVAEGNKQAAILNAEAAKAAKILEAEADKEAAIKRAEGEATAILQIQQATAQGLEMIKGAKADQAVISLRSLETLEKVADGKATKIIIPSQIQDTASLITALSEVVKK